MCPGLPDWVGQMRHSVRPLWALDWTSFLFFTLDMYSFGLALAVLDWLSPNHSVENFSHAFAPNHVRRSKWLGPQDPMQGFVCHRGRIGGVNCRTK